MEDKLGFVVLGRDDRHWLVTLDVVGADYADYLKNADGLSDEEAKAAAVSEQKFWPTWFAEQFSWVDVMGLGEVYTGSAPRELMQLDQWGMTDFETINL